MALSDHMKPALVVLVALMLLGAGAVAVLMKERSVFASELDHERRRADMALTLLEVMSGLQQELMILEQATASGAAALQGMDLEHDGVDIQNVLDKTMEASPYIINILVVNTALKVVSLAPGDYDHMLGIELSDDDPTAKVIGSRQPVLSGLFTVVDGFQGVTMVYPIIDVDGTIAGSISTLFRPDKIMENIATSHEGFGFMIVQSDGVQVFDTDLSQIGTDTFTDPMFADSPEITDLANRMLSELSGVGHYTFHQSGGKSVSKEVIWSSIGLISEKWVVAINTAL